jgi:hypothetical protein
MLGGLPSAARSRSANNCPDGDGYLGILSVNSRRRTEMSPEKIKFEVARVVSQGKHGTT